MGDSRTVKVAFATANGCRVDGSFERAPEIVICEIGTHRFREVDVLHFEMPATYEVSACDSDCGGSGKKKHKADTMVDEDLLALRVKSVDGAAALFVNKPLNAKSALQLNEAHVFTIRVDEPEPIADLVVRMQEMLQLRPPLWLRRAFEATAAESH